MTAAEQLAEFAVQAPFDGLAEPARQQLKIRVLDALGCAIGALAGPPVLRLRQHVEDFGGRPMVTLIGGGKTAPDRAAFFNSALVRYLDFNDSYLAKGETCHPSDNLGAVLAAAESAGADGKTFLTALAVAYQVLCRLCEAAPVRAKGFDHTTLGSFALAAGMSRALGLDRARAANAIAISGAAFNALRVTRTGALSNWKGLAYPNTAFCCAHAVFLAQQGITGPLEVFEGNKGLMEAISGPFIVDWPREPLDRVPRTIIKKYNAEIHSQSVLAAVLALRRQAGFRAADVSRVEVAVFDVAFHIIGGGEEGAKTLVRTKEEADHSLPYMVAVAIEDGQVMPEQYLPERIRRESVQALLRNVHIRPDAAYSARFPDEMPCRVTVHLRDGRVLTQEGRDYEGFHSRPAGWDAALDKFHRLAEPFAPVRLRQEIAETIAGLENRDVAALMALLAAVGSAGGPARSQG